MKILPAAQIRALDAHTIENDPIASIDLMERASLVFCQWFQELFPDDAQELVIFCGPGNNGGDGLAVARLLHEKAYPVQVFLCELGSPTTDHQFNKRRLMEKGVIPIEKIKEDSPLPQVNPSAIIIDAILGSGLTRPLAGYLTNLVEYLNQLPNTCIAIDIPSGMFADQVTNSLSIRAQHTLSFEVPKLAMLMPENAHRVGDWEVRSIGLDQAYLTQLATDYELMDQAMVKSLLRKRQRFEHKGSFGHALLIAGSYGKVGAATLSAKAILRSGAGLVTIHAPRCAYEILQIAFPEAMVEVDRHRFVFSQAAELAPYRSIGIGPGLGQNKLTIEAIKDLLPKVKKPMVIDADALNILSQQPELQKQLPPHSILTPHPKEFERLFGPSDNDFSRLDLLVDKARELNAIIILKTGMTAIVLPTGKVYFNVIGNPGMGTAGAGDVLTGILTGLLAQGYQPADAARLGVYLHALAGDIAAEELEQESLLAEDIIACLGKAYKRLKA